MNRWLTYGVKMHRERDLRGKHASDIANSHKNISWQSIHDIEAT